MFIHTRIYKKDKNGVERKYGVMNRDMIAGMSKRTKRRRAESIVQNALTALPSILAQISRTFSLEQVKKIQENDIMLIMGYFTSGMARETIVTGTVGSGRDIEGVASERDTLLDWMFRLTKTNMKPMYDSCPGWGWDDDEKYKELAHEDARFLVVSYCHDMDSQGRDPSEEPPKENDRRKNTHTHGTIHHPIGFVHLRYEIENWMPVVYVYEIQISSEYRGFQLGSWLMNYVETLARFYQCSLVMLTVFLNNKKAREFYHRLGYGMDPSSPEENHDIHKGAGYQILSKIIDKDIPTILS